MQLIWPTAGTLYTHRRGLHSIYRTRTVMGDGTVLAGRPAVPPFSDDPPTPLHDNVFRRVFMGGAYSEYKRLIGFAYAFEQAMHVRLSRKVFVET